MTPDEVTMIQGAGQVFVRNSAYIVPLTLLYGMYVLLAFTAIYTLLYVKSLSSFDIEWDLIRHLSSRRRSLSRSTLALSALLIITFGITTAYYILYVTVDIMLMQVGLVENTSLPLTERFNIANKSVVQTNVAAMWVGGENGLLYFFSDGIVVWRAWAIWPERRRVVLIPGVLLFASFMIFLTSSGMRTVAGVSPSFITNSTFASLVIAGYTMSVATNLSSTLLIGYKAYRHRQFMKDTIGVRNSRAGKVLVLLTESGLVYIIFQIIGICLAFPDNAPRQSSLNITAHVWGVVMNMVSAINPALIILIVTYHHSIAQMTNIADVENGTGFDAGTHISFASSPRGNTNTAKTQMDSYLSQNGQETSLGEKPESKGEP